MGPAERDVNSTANLLAGGGGFEPPLRGPEPRVLPLDDPPPTPQPYHTAEKHSADRRLERAAGSKAGYASGRNLNLLAGARVTAVARSSARHHERPESGNRHAPAAAQRLHDAVDEGIHGALGGNLRAPCVLRHDCHQLGLG